MRVAPSVPVSASRPKPPRRLNGSLVEFFNMVGRFGDPITDLDAYCDWQRVIDEGGTPPPREATHKGFRIGSCLQPPSVQREGVRILGAYSILGEVVDPLACPTVPIGRMFWQAELYRQPECTGNPDSIVWAEYRIGVPDRHSTPAGDEGDAHISLELEISPHYNSPYSLPDSVGEVWDTFGLEDIIPCPDEGPLACYRAEGRPAHIRALTNFILKAQAAQQ